MGKDDQGRELRSVTIRTSGKPISGYGFGPGMVIDSATGEEIKGAVQSIKIEAKIGEFTMADVTFGGVVLDDIKTVGYFHVQCPCGNKIALADAPKPTGEIVELRSEHAFPVAIAKDE